MDISEKIDKKTLRRLEHLCYKTRMPFYYRAKYKVPEVWRECIKREEREMISRKTKGRVDEIFEIAYENKLTYEELDSVWLEKRRERYKNDREYSKKPIQTLKDNGKFYIGGGGSNCNKVRRPSKKRSKRVWRNFYRLFPYEAEKDGWKEKQ